MTEDQVREFSRDHLANYKLPRSVTFIDELPKTGSGKILKRELQTGAPIIYRLGADGRAIDRKDLIAPRSPAAPPVDRII